MPINIDRYEDLAGNVLKIYEEAERTIMRRVKNRVERGITQPGWTERKYGEMRDVSREMTRYVDDLSRNRGEMQRQYIEQAYTDARNAFISDARTFGELSQIEGLTPNTMKVVNIMSELDSMMDAADRRILRSVNDAYADIVGNASALVATGTITYREAVQRELNDFANRGITSFVDRAGRSWDMETYAEMATLTAIERATREGYIDAMTEFGYDLAEISDHYGACPICEAWQGVIISVSGSTPGYPSLAEAQDAGVFHPRCMHDFSVYYEGLSPEGRKAPREVGEPNPGYAARSEQRGLERHIREWKRRMAVAATPEEERAAYARVRMYQERLRDLVNEYNSTVDPSIDRLPRKYWREGGRAKLSADAKKIKPVQIPESQRPKPVKIRSSLAETKAFSRSASGAAYRIIDGNGISLGRQSREEIMLFFRDVERNGGITATRNSDGVITQVVMKRGTYEKLEQLTDKLVNRIYVKDKGLARDYSKILSIVRKPHYLSAYDRANIPDFRDYTRSNSKYTRITLDANATSVDSLYEELQSLFPGYFSDDVKTPSDRLIEINSVLETLDEIRTVPAKDYYGTTGIKEMSEEIWRDITREYFNVQDKAIRGRKK